MKRWNCVLLTAAGLLCAASAGAEDRDGSVPLVCDLAEAAQCNGVASCQDVLLAQIDLPPVVHVNFAARRIEAPGEQRTSPIAAFEALEEVLVLQGHQNGRGWTMVIDRATGHLSATVADSQGAFVLAGACSAL